MRAIEAKAQIVVEFNSAANAQAHVDGKPITFAHRRERTCDGRSANKGREIWKNRMSRYELLNRNRSYGQLFEEPIQIAGKRRRYGAGSKQLTLDTHTVDVGGVVLITCYGRLHQLVFE